MQADARLIRMQIAYAAGNSRSNTDLQMSGGNI
jgi:hypothetical protein